MELTNPILFDPRALQAGDLAAAGFLASLPETRGIYLFSAAGQPPHLGSSLNLKRRLSRLLVPSYTRKDLALSQYLQNFESVACWPAGSRLESSLLLYQITRRHFPADYLKRLRLRLPWFLSLNDADPFPRLEISNRPPAKLTEVYGPFFSRDLAQRYEQDVAGLFQVRRCSEPLDPTPAHPGCIYGEMNQCLRPCQCAVSPGEYANEVARLAAFLHTNGKSAASVLSNARERAAAGLEYEEAAQIHKRLEKLHSAAAGRDPVIAALDEFNGVALTRGIAPLEYRLWPVLQGYWQKAVTLNVSALESSTRSLDQQLRETLSGSLHGAHEAAGNRIEQLALFARWYYSTWRDGHWFAFRKSEDLNYRRLVREISNMSRPQN